MNTQAYSALVLHFDWLASPVLLAVLTGIGALLLAASIITGRRQGIVLRVLATTAFLVVLANPSLMEEQRRSARDVAVVVMDSSPSNTLPTRSEQSRAALEYLKNTLLNRDDLELRTLELPSPEDPEALTSTRLFGPLSQALSDVPRSRRAGVIFITDGQIHDVPDKSALSEFGPVHTLLTGSPEEKDRRIVMLEAPFYGLIGQNVRIRFRIEDKGTGFPQSASITLRTDSAVLETLTVPTGSDQTFVLPVEHAGQNVLELETPVVTGEISAANNRAAISVNGVRDRLRVLLISGVPHAGERMWRDTLTSDPGVDLVHFTILRDPSKIDNTPAQEMSLIAFPFHELFEEKLSEFDLIIFDRYRRNDTMPDFYFGNITRYVERGGALLLSVGPEFSQDSISIFHTAFSDLLPVSPDGQVYEETFRPAKTPIGARHPVTAGMKWNKGVEWGSWYRQIGLERVAGDSDSETLMEGPDNRPLLILSRKGQGRLALLASDQLWLWARGHDGGGPHADLIRRIAHWLMKEPELEENALDLAVSGKELIVRRRLLKAAQQEEPILTDPDGVKTRIALKPGEDGWEDAKIPLSKTGVYRVDSDSLSRVVIAGEPNAPENADIRATEEKVAPVARASGGGILWLARDPAPKIRDVSPGAASAGRGWIGLRRNADYTVSGVTIRPLLSPATACAALLAAVVLAWMQEAGRFRRKSNAPAL